MGRQDRHEVRKMEVLDELAKYPIFGIKEVMELAKSEEMAYNKLRSLKKSDQVRKIRNNMYSVVNPATGRLAANRYQIASAITETAYLSHHSAFEYYGLAKQILNEVYVSSERIFNHFTYDNVTYKYVSSKMDEGIVEAQNIPGVRVTDLERTVIDSIRDLKKTGGFEELIYCLEGIHYLEEMNLRKYLEIYNIESLYQKVGDFLSPYRKQMQISRNFIEYCRNKNRLDITSQVVL